MEHYWEFPKPQTPTRRKQQTNLNKYICAKDVRCENTTPLHPKPASLHIKRDSITEGFQGILQFLSE